MSRDLFELPPNRRVLAWTGPRLGHERLSAVLAIMTGFGAEGEAAPTLIFRRAGRARDDDLRQQIEDSLRARSQGDDVDRQRLEAVRMSMIPPCPAKRSGSMSRPKGDDRRRHPLAHPPSQMAVTVASASELGRSSKARPVRCPASLSVVSGVPSSRLSRHSPGVRQVLHTNHPRTQCGRLKNRQDKWRLLPFLWIVSCRATAWWEVDRAAG